MYTRLTLYQWMKAVRMWRDGKDTDEIARWFKCRESMIYNQLPKYRAVWTDDDLKVSA